MVNPRDTVKHTSLGKSASGAVVRSAAADFPWDVCLTVSRNHAVFLFCTLRYSLKMRIQVLQLIVLAAFGAVD